MPMSEARSGGPGCGALDLGSPCVPPMRIMYLQPLTLCLRLKSFRDTLRVPPNRGYRTIQTIRSF